MTTPLAALIAKQKGIKANEPDALQAENVPTPDVSSEAATDVGDGNIDESDSPEQLAHEPTTTQPTLTAGAPVRFGRKDVAAGTPQSPASSADTDGGTKQTKLAQRFGNHLRPSPQPSGDSGGAEQPGTEDLCGDLAALSESEVGGELRRPSMFDDEVPADAPLRELEGLEEGQLGFVKSLDTVYSLVHEPSLLGDVISSIMMELQSNPEYRKLIQPKDVRVMIVGMRDAMGMARIKKAEKKRPAGGQAGKKSKAVDADMLADLDALGDIE